jgi:hypothetical protein
MDAAMNKPGFFDMDQKASVALEWMNRHCFMLLYMVSAPACGSVKDILSMYRTLLRKQCVYGGIHADISLSTYR